MAQELAAMGEDVVVITGTELGAAPELDEGFDILRNRSLAQILGALMRCDVVLSRGGLSRVAVILGRLAGCRVALFHEMATLPHKRRRWVMGLERLVHLHVGVSHAVLETKLLAPRTPRCVLYNPVAQEIWSDDPPTLDARDIDALFVGRFIEGKGVLDLVKAMAEFDRPIRLTMIGGGPVRPRVEALAASAPSLRVDLPGYVAREKLAAYYRRARVFVLPSSTHPEGMGMVVAEAMSTGTPVLVSDQPVLLETMGTAGLAFEAGNTEALKAQLHRLLTDRDLWQQCSDAALTERERFSASAYRAALTDFLDRLHIGQCIPADRFGLNKSDWKS